MPANTDKPYEPTYTDDELLCGLIQAVERMTNSELVVARSIAKQRLYAVNTEIAQRLKARQNRTKPNG